MKNLLINFAYDKLYWTLYLLNFYEPSHLIVAVVEELEAGVWAYALKNKMPSIAKFHFTYTYCHSTY